MEFRNSFGGPRIDEGLSQNWGNQVVLNTEHQDAVRGKARFYEVLSSYFQIAVVFCVLHVRKSRGQAGLK